ncbi:hypothetical protein M9Y10_026523 [Tritrichomonas musculus]|uniref:Uncharacterized protein n=1 Tax=Tritrichomonas musculus TaxID=1915356 RepID=A0ABR2H7T9_9EUKA
MSRTTLNGSHINAPTSPEPKTQRLIIHRVVQQYDRPPTSPGSDLRLPQSYRSYLARCPLLCGKIFQCNCRPMHFVNFLCYKAFMRERFFEGFQRRTAGGLLSRCSTRTLMRNAF